MTSVFKVIPIEADESLVCYLLRVATSESVAGIGGLVRHMSIGPSNASLNKNIEKLAAFTKQPLEALKAGRVCLQPSHPVLREKFARMSSNPFCPHCVRESGYFCSAWRHGLVTACTKHRCQLVESCPACHRRVDFARGNAFFCDCGQELSAIDAPEADSGALWVSGRIASSDHIEQGWPNFGHATAEQWQTFDELIFLFGSYNQPIAEEIMQPRRSGKFHSIAEANEFLKAACANFENFPDSFEHEVCRRLARGDRGKAGLANRLGYWFRAFRSLTDGAYPELREAFARSVAQNFDGHDSKNPWIHELAPSGRFSITEAAKRLGVKSSRLRVMLANMSGAEPLREHTFNTVTQEQVEALREHLNSAFNLSEVLETTGLAESVLRQFIRVGLLPKRERPEWDLNTHKPFDVADVQAMQRVLFGFIEHQPQNDSQTISINDVNKRIATNKVVVEELFEKIADGTLKAVNVETPKCLGDLLYDRDEIKQVVGNAHDLAMMTAEQLARLTGWKSDSVRYWIKSGLLVGEEGQLRGRPAYWVSTGALHAFMRDYKVISELAVQLGTSPKALSERLRQLGVPIFGAMSVAPGVTRGGLVALKDVLGSGLYQSQVQLFGHSVQETADKPTQIEYAVIQD